MHEIIEMIIQNAGSFSEIITVPIVYYLYKCMDKYASDNAVLHETIDSSVNMLKENDLNIIRAKLQDLTSRYLDKGQVTYEELSVMDSLFDSYTKLGGNSFIKVAVGKVHNLPLRNNGGNDNE